MIKKIAIVAIIVVLAAVAFVGYAFFRPPEEASAPIEAVPLNVEENQENQENDVADAAPGEAPAADTAESEPVADDETQVEEASAATEAESESEMEAEAAETEPEAEPEVAAPESGAAEAEAGSDVAETEPAEAQAEVMADEAATEAEVEENNAEDNGAEEAAAATETEAPAEEASTGPTIFEIIPGQSEARFLIDEVLRGDPITVVGATDQVAGQLALDPMNLADTQVGVMQVNARTLATDNNFRNRAIKNRILLTDEYEFVTFNPTEVVGLPESAAVGEPLTFQVVGDLTVTDVTRQVTFDITATPVDENLIEGTASTAFLYTDFDLFIPDARVVDTVDDEVRLEIDFVAEAVSGVAG